MLLDVETNAHCAIAALDTLGHELAKAPLGGDLARRVKVMLGLARQHVTELVTTAAADDVAPATHMGARPSPSLGHPTPASSSEALAAWTAAAGIRRATLPADVEQYRCTLEALARRTENLRVRQICKDALARCRATPSR
jgi:hypothetical protein